MPAVEFGQQYYKKVIEENGYDPSIFKGFTQDLPGIPRSDLERVFLCHDGLYDFSDSGGKKAVVTGFGLSGVPHIGTLSQIHRISRINQAGFQAEVVLGDLDAYNGKLTPLDKTLELASTYARFIENTGLLDPSSTRVRDQFGHPEVLRTAYLLGRFVEDALFDDAEEDLHLFYVAHGRVDKEMTYRRKLSLSLMLADFIHLGQSNPDVLVMLGIDEHQYVRAGQELARKVDTEDSGINPVRIHALYTPIIKGLNGYPKMSKSFSESGITLDMEQIDVAAAVMNELDNFRTPEDSVIFQMACGIGLGEQMSLDEAFAAALHLNADWKKVKEILVARIAMFNECWQEALMT